ncbi:GTP-binding protein [Candidatus Woesearchaeota archaeon]|jgi:[FeFe] hydrogenase H-cluster maturation GTPase HydF|nr:GTP-binding protein [Candidatus Woesearchaeota archaeon]MBT3537212.1 GTP-binding protein [Candidatus Woesearchaeota archaeon]MBT4698199.1 GTP-binding protein [Candidatus Woesearchaeota archaeon]MBT7106478.1 GTP-binding protein [Candidatus Woesearchaeota archaeon]MBT7931147.1 GTP-binding protein [Candidatus Woesearchaeota archaeon]
MNVQKENIGIFGKVNSGKSSLMNLFLQQEASIVDSTPGTTADTKVSLIEIHGLGPVRLFDTAGVDEGGELGEKKREKVFSNLKECDLVLLVINPETDDLSQESEIIARSRELNKELFVVYNVFGEMDSTVLAENIKRLEGDLSLLRFYKSIHLSVIDAERRAELLDFILSTYVPKSKPRSLLPFIEKGEYYVLIIPMDAETPAGRYLRPQSMVEEHITRNWGHPVSFRMDLSAGRGPDFQKEKERYLSFLSEFKRKPKMIITDSQAIDLVAPWTPDEVGVTTFSIVMINHMSGGRLSTFVDGLKVLSSLRSGDKVLIVEACNHSRIEEDIGTVQIPNYIEEKFPGVVIEHNFGREFQDNDHLADYSLIIHCGGCMISSQKLMARLRDLSNVDVPVTNYGLFLSYIQGSEVLKKVLLPWKIKCLF